MAQINVLYVEDHDLVLFTVKQMLELEGWRAHVCRDGAHALKQLNSDEHYDLIILDAELPGASGFELIRHGRALPQRAATPVIMFSALDCADEALAAGADVYLKKPAGIKDLLDTCGRLMRLDPAHESDGHRPTATKARNNGSS